MPLNSQKDSFTFPPPSLFAYAICTLTPQPHIIFPKPMQQTCPKCGNEYDYFSRAATIVCVQNHVACKTCAAGLRECPTCYRAVGEGRGAGGTNPYGNGVGDVSWGQQQQGSANLIYPAINTNTYNQYRPQASPVYPASPAYQPPNQGFQPTQPLNQGFRPVQPYAPAQPQPVPGQPFAAQPFPIVPQPKNTCIFMFLFFVMIAAITTMSILLSQMNTCQYWGYRSCEYYSYSSTQCCSTYSYYQCPTTDKVSYLCYPIYEVRQWGQYLRTDYYIGIAVCAVMALLFLCRFVAVRKANRAINLGVAGQGAYMRV